MTEAAAWLAIGATAVGLLLGALRLGSMIATKHAGELEEQRARKRFGLYFPEEGEESPLSVPARLDRGDRRFEEVERALGENRTAIEDLGTKVETGFGEVREAIAAHTSSENDLGDRLEHLVGELIEVRKRRADEAQEETGT